MLFLFSLSFYTNVYICNAMEWEQTYARMHARICTRKKNNTLGIFYFQISRTSRHTMNINNDVIFFTIPYHSVSGHNVCIFGAKTDFLWKFRENIENMVKMLFNINKKDKCKTLEKKKTWKNKNDGEFPWIACNNGVMRIQLSLKVCCNVCRKQNQTSCERISNNRLQIPSGLNSNASLNGGCMSAFCAFMCIHIFFSSIRKSH